MIPPTILIEDTDFNAAWARAVRAVLREGVDLVIGDVSEPKPIKDVCGIISLTGNAISQIEDRELHPQFPFQHISQYCEEFTWAYLRDYLRKLERERFSYLYFERLAGSRGDYLEQVEVLNDGLASQVDDEIASNRNQAMIWKPCIDADSKVSPCLQRIWIRHLGNMDIEVHLTWRSRDLYTAWQVNIVAIIDMLNREVIHPNECNIVKIVDYSDSLHIYKSDLDAARKVKLVRMMPRLQ